ncbi:PTB domain-containing engulfment adapter protein 1 [Parasteatoda tepidariorum]|uniref:PTB domain-containing engulfment adapter protein 1 n=1 Tax=Parasteatoda tepidariorum TaxID=114398 RepID=A0A2L2Y0Z0_PARTP|nr:PTB domain-containing engulfment adapter protein 1 [Parasteatoda tepidariorum]XP_015921607.1 PTB domain-containing engulfment adapter protein 1 [Parasteatoda tepidariorum]
MIKQSNLLKWAQNNKNNSKNGTNKSWIHPPDALQHGHVAYLVKFLGSVEVDQAKGIDVVKDGIRKLKFNQQLKKSEGTKTPKVEVTISIDGVAIQDNKTKQIFHQYPLHRISYCANDKSDKKFFSFIAKEDNGEKHMCFVFASDKLAEDITLTIGEAFDLAYRKFLDTSGRDLEAKKQLMILQKRVQELEKENSLLKQRLSTFTKESITSNGNMKNGQTPQNLLNLNGEAVTRHQSTIEPGRNAALQQNVRNEIKSMPPTSPSQELFNLVSFPIAPAVGTKLENLALDEFEDFNPREDNVITNGNKAKASTDIFGAPPFNPTKNSNADPFGMGDFSTVPSSHGVDLENAIGELDKKISEMRDGFSRGLSFGNEDFFDSHTAAETH